MVKLRRTCDSCSVGAALGACANCLLTYMRMEHVYEQMDAWSICAAGTALMYGAE